MSGGGCQVPLSGEAGTGLCGWETEGRTPWCAAHRRRMRVHGDPLGDVPVRRKPSRRPFAVAQRQAAQRVTKRRRDVERERQTQMYAAQLEQTAAARRALRRTAAALA